MTPEEIVAELDRLPPMTRKGFAAQFQGVPFEWMLQFSKAEAEREADSRCPETDRRLAAYLWQASCGTNCRVEDSPERRKSQS